MTEKQHKNWCHHYDYLPYKAEDLLEKCGYCKHQNKEEQACKDMADVCELAHARTVLECEKLGITVDCTSETLCGDDENHHEDGNDDQHYTTEAQRIFNRHYDDIIEKTGL